MLNILSLLAVAAVERLRLAAVVLAVFVLQH
jgi:hypothetical protein